MAKLEASVQYGDWKGKIAADGADKNDIHEFFRQKSPNAGMLVAWNLYVSDSGQPNISGLFVEYPSIDEAEKSLDTSNPVPVTVVKEELSAEEFFKLFKRFDIVGFKRNAIDLEDANFDGWVS